jgi:hypothetical protein
VALAPPNNTGVGEITPTSSYPSANNVWTVIGYEDNGSSIGNWNLRAYVLCITP